MNWANSKFASEFRQFTSHMLCGAKFFNIDDVSAEQNIMVMILYEIYLLDHLSDSKSKLKTNKISQDMVYWNLEYAVETIIFIWII